MMRVKKTHTHTHTHFRGEKKQWPENFCFVCIFYVFLWWTTEIKRNKYKWCVNECHKIASKQTNNNFQRRKRAGDGKKHSVVYNSLNWSFHLWHFVECPFHFNFVRVSCEHFHTSQRFQFNCVNKICM